MPSLPARPPKARPTLPTAPTTAPEPPSAPALAGLQPMNMDDHDTQLESGEIDNAMVKTLSCQPGRAYLACALVVPVQSCMPEAFPARRMDLSGKRPSLM